MIDLSWLEKLGLELLLMACIAIGCFIWGDTHRGTADAKTYAADLVVAQNKQNLIDKKLQDVTNQLGLTAQAASDNQAEADRENRYAIKLENEIKTHPLPIDCKPSAARVQWINGAGKN